MPPIGTTTTASVGPNRVSPHLHTVVAALLLAGGLAIYLLWRPPVLVMFDGVDVLRLNAEIAWLRGAAAPIGAAIPAWIPYSVPYALWVAAWIVFMRGVWQSAHSREAWIWTYSLPLVACGAEIAQALWYVPGTFDPLDLLLLSLMIPFARAIS